MPILAVVILVVICIVIIIIIDLFIIIVFIIWPYRWSGDAAFCNVGNRLSNVATARRTIYVHLHATLVSRWSTLHFGHLRPKLLVSRWSALHFGSKT